MTVYQRPFHLDLLPQPDGPACLRLRARHPCSARNRYFTCFYPSFLAGSLHPLAGHFIAEHYVYETVTTAQRDPANGIPVPETFSYYGALNFLTYNVGLHNEHHDFPAVPWTRLPVLHETAKEFYADLPHHRSWTYVIWQFIFDDQVGLRCRVKRKNGGRVVGGGNTQAKVADWKQSEIEA